MHSTPGSGVANEHAAPASSAEEHQATTHTDEKPTHVLSTNDKILRRYNDWVESDKNRRWNTWLDEQPSDYSKAIRAMVEINGIYWREFYMDSYCVLPVGSVLSVAPRVGEQEKASLMGMPAEIRNKIWRHALTVPTAQDGTVRLAYRHKSANYYAGDVNDIDDSFKKNLHRKKRPGPSVLSLLQTCRRIYHEAAAMFYHYNELRTNVKIEWFSSSRPSIRKWSFPNFQSPERLLGVQSLTVKLDSHRDLCGLLKASQEAIDPRRSGLNRFPNLKKLVIEYDLENGVHSTSRSVDSVGAFSDLDSAFKARINQRRINKTIRYFKNFHLHSKHGNLGRLDIFVKDLWNGQVVCTTHTEKLLGWTYTTPLYQGWYEQLHGATVSGPFELKEIMGGWDDLTGDLLLDDDDGYLAAILDAVKLPKETTNATNTDSRKRKRDSGVEEMFSIIRPRKSAKLD